MTHRLALVVDDSRSARFAMRKYLERYRYDVTTAEDGREALGYLREHRPLVVFLDYLMPGVNGLEVLRSIKSDPATVSIPVVICTSVDRADFKQEARWSGAIEVLQKPPSLEQLQLLLESLERSAALAPAPQAAPAAAPATAAVPLGPPPIPEAAERYTVLRSQIDGALKRLTEEIFVQLAELRAQLVRLEEGGLTREDVEAFRQIAREEADALNQALRGELEMIRQRLESMDQLQRADRAEMLTAARETAAAEAKTVAHSTVLDAASRISHKISDALIKTLGKP